MSTLTVHAVVPDRPTDRTSTDGVGYAELSDAQRTQIEQRRAIVDAWRRTLADYAAGGRSRADATALFLALHPDLSRSTLYRWAALREDPDPAALLDGRARERARPQPNSIGDAAWSRFLALYLTTQRRTAALCHQVVAIEAQDHTDAAGRPSPAWAWPSLRTVQRRVAEIPATHADFFRLGEKEWRRRHEPSIARDYTQYRAGEYWVGDFHECDVFCRRSATDPTIVRPLLGCFIDLRSRMIMGWHIGMAENADAVLLTLADGVRKYGPPWHVVIDNGKPYRAQGVSGGRPRSTRLIADEEGFRARLAALPGLNIAVHFAIPFNPNSKLVERWFGTLESQFGALFATYCGGGKDDRFRLAFKLAHDDPQSAPTVDEFREQFGRYLAGYHATPHTGEGMTGLSPEAAFAQFDPIPRSICPDDVLELLIMKGTEPVVVGKDGVRYAGVLYGSTDPRVWDRHGQKLPLRVHPEDASFVVLCELDGRPIARLVNNRLALAQVSREDVADGMKAKARARRHAKQIREGILAPLNQNVVDAAIAARQAAGRIAQKKLMAATGTDAVAVSDQQSAISRNIAPLRSDLAASTAAFAHRAIQPPAATPRPSLTDLAEALESGQPSAVSDQRSVLSLTDLFSAEGGAA